MVCKKCRAYLVTKFWIGTIAFFGCKHCGRINPGVIVC